jgi:ATP-dependent Clp protease adaptor protein ClpS
VFFVATPLPKLGAAANIEWWNALHQRCHPTWTGCFRWLFQEQYAGDPVTTTPGQTTDPGRPRIDQRQAMTDRKTDKDGGQSQVILETRQRTKKPSMYKVIMLNDDYTPMEFVVYVLQRFFNMSNSQATAIMLNVHQRGVGVCGVYSYEVAEAKATQVMDHARQNEHPLQLQIEKE